MPRSISEYVASLEKGEKVFLQLVTDPVLIWDTTPTAPKSDEESLGTVSGHWTKRPRSGNPLVYEVKKGTSKGNAFAFGITLGRAETNDIPLEDRSVSRFHAYLQGTGRSWKVADAESKNGTFLGALKLVSNKPQPLQDRARLRLGDVELLFLFPESFFTHIKTLMGYR